MNNKMMMLIFSLFLLSCLKSGEAVKCEAFSGSNCGCELDDGSKMAVDLTPITILKPIPMFSKVLQSTATVFVDFCRSFNCEQGSSPSRVCAEFSGAGFKQNISYGNTLTYEYDEKSKIVTFVFKSGQQVSRAILHCSNKPGIGTIDITGSQSYSLEITLTSRYACWNRRGGDSSRDSSRDGLSIGTILCITLLAVLVVYIVAGILINKYIRKVEDDVFPNKKAWSNFLPLVKDGFVFTWGKIRKNGSEYEKI